jgi:hypothetical protein
MKRISLNPTHIGYLLVILIFSLVISSTPFAHARFTKTTCVGTECIQQNALGAWCYIPVSTLTRATSCNGGTDESTDFATVLEVNLAQTLSIAYYNGVDNTFLGGANYPISATPGIIRLCASGRSGDGNLQTLCVNAVADNAFANSPYCHVLRGQNNVSDGCYDPNEVVQSPAITTSFGINGGSPTVTVTVTVTRSSGARINTVLTLGVLLLAIMVGIAC